MSVVADHKRQFFQRLRAAVPMRFVEIGVFALAVLIGAGTYFLISGVSSTQRLLSPQLIALLLVANLLPAMGLLVLIGRRVAKRRAAASPIGGDGRLHVRLVALFSAMAAIPMLFVTIFASLLFQHGVEFWFSDRAGGMLENASAIAHENYELELTRIGKQVETMSGDLSKYYLDQFGIDSPTFARGLFYQTYQRELSEAIIVHVTPDGHINSLALVDPYERDLEQVINLAMIKEIRNGQKTLIVPSLEAPGALTKLDWGDENYLYATRVFDKQTATLLRRGKAIVDDYHALLTRSRSLQLKFNAALMIVSLLIVGLAVFIALAVADRLVRPVGDLVDAARKVAGGDLSARVSVPASEDEIGTLASAFNRMTGRLQEQTNALVAANAQIESRRALIEAVMSGVRAGVISIGEDHSVRLINRSAMEMLRTGDTVPVGQPLKDIAPDLEAVLDQGGREAVVQMTIGGEAKTLAVKITRDENNRILTFDDITQQLLDQRRAAWSDVARRIAHEIKNPLTPIQLAAERLQRRYGKQIDPADSTFARLTETIVRQVGDLRRMVDEFSSFARMPKPVFRDESLLDIVRQAVFLHEVAHPDIAFKVDHDGSMPHLVCDRRQIGQALSNLVKNAVEAVEAKHESDQDSEVVASVASDAEGHITVRILDTGIGLPVERDRIVEPYMTTRARGTGLGLAIVKKIVEEHFGTIEFADRPDKEGTEVKIIFDGALLAGLAETGGETPGEAETPHPTLTRHRNNA
ncbi:two-component system nitrogen regulation sensor histidine kinase NtrY [Stakelama pacifica]|uniref:histidine kinase n=2 Tax=Stakelama pacifica TaxID=517720 RepID=A0A4R6FZC2_9SPHN|nr:two-component system nitrogen regulation sensor histidine kinase NtrY [Stakelama pacifica]